MRDRTVGGRGIYHDIPGQEIELPMAIVILGGLVTSTLLNLFVIPVLYLRFGSGGQFEVMREQFA